MIGELPVIKAEYQNSTNFNAGLTNILFILLEAGSLATVIAWMEGLLDVECKEKRGIPEWVKSTLDELACDQREKGQQSERTVH